MNNTNHNEVIQYTVSDVTDQLFLQDGELWCRGNPDRRTKKKQVDHYIDDRVKIMIFTEANDRGIANVNTKTAKYILVHNKFPDSPVIIDDDGHPIKVSTSMFLFYINAEKSHIYKQIDDKKRKHLFVVRMIGLTGLRMIQAYKTIEEAEKAVKDILRVVWKPELERLNIYKSFCQRM